MVRFTRGLVRYRPLLFLVNLLAWSVSHMAPLLPGYLTKVYYDGLAGDAPLTITPLSILVLLAAVGITRGLYVEERLAGIEDLKALGGLVHAMRRMASLIAVQVQRARRAYSLGTLVWPVVNVVMGIGTGLMLAWGGMLALRGEMTIGTVYLLFSYLNLMFWPFEDLAHQMEELQKAGGNLVRIQRLFAARGSLRDGTRRVLPPGPVGLAFENVSFSYPGAETGDSATDREAQEAVLRELSFRIEAGRSLGILGRSGSGKTTVTRLLARLYDPSAGRVTLNGVDLREYRLSAVRAGISVVTQEVQFFRGSIRDNLCLFDPGRRPAPGGCLRAARSAVVARAPAGRAGHHHQQRAARPVRGRGAASGPGAGVPARSRHRDPGRGGRAAGSGHRARGRARPQGAAPGPHRGGDRPPPAFGREGRRHPGPGGRQDRGARAPPGAAGRSSLAAQRVARGGSHLTAAT